MERPALTEARLTNHYDLLTYAITREVFDTDVYVYVDDLIGQLDLVPMRGSRGT
jgi:hypothetical protein